MIKSHRDLKVWQAGMEITVCVYEVTKEFPKSELFGLTSQMRRAAASIPANIAEGFSRQYKTEFTQFLHVAEGSLSELDTYLDLSQRLGYLDAGRATFFTQRIEAIGKMIHGLISSLRRNEA